MHGATNTPKNRFRCASVLRGRMDFHMWFFLHILFRALVSRSELFVNLNTLEAKSFASYLQASLTPEFHRNNLSDSPELSNGLSFGLRCSCLRFRSRRVSTA